MNAYERRMEQMKSNIDDYREALWTALAVLKMLSETAGENKHDATIGEIFSVKMMISHRLLDLYETKAKTED